MGIGATPLPPENIRELVALTPNSQMNALAMRGAQPLWKRLLALSTQAFALALGMVLGPMGCRGLWLRGIKTCQEEGMVGAEWRHDAPEKSGSAQH